MTTPVFCTFVIALLRHPVHRLRLRIATTDVCTNIQAWRRLFQRYLFHAAEVDVECHNQTTSMAVLEALGGIAVPSPRQTEGTLNRLALRMQGGRELRMPLFPFRGLLQMLRYRCPHLREIRLTFHNFVWDAAAMCPPVDVAAHHHHRLDRLTLVIEGAVAEATPWTVLLAVLGPMRRFEVYLSDPPTDCWSAWKTAAGCDEWHILDKRSLTGQ